MARFDDISPQDIDPDTGRPYRGYSSPSLDTSFHDNEMALAVSWDRWIAKVETKLECPNLDHWSFGISLIDHAHAAFQAGLTVSNYWAHVVALQAYLLVHGEDDAREQILTDYREWKTIARRRAA